MTSSKFSDLRKQAEQLLRSKTSAEGTENDLDTSMTLDELFHDLEVHQIELEMQHAELQEALEEIKDNRREYVDLFDYAPLGYVVTDEKGMIISVNLTLATMFGMGRVQIEGRLFAKFISQPYTDIYYLSRQNVFASGDPQTCEVSIQLPDNRGFFARLDSTLIEDKNRCRMAITDITQQKKAEHAQRIALEREQELNQLKSRLLEMITHEFRTPLSIILSSIDIIERYSERLDDNAKERRYQGIRDQVWHMSRMVKEIAGAYRAEIDTLNVTPATFDCQQSLDNLVNDFETVTPNRLTLSVINSDNYNVTFDEMLLKQILINLINNASKFSMNEVTVQLQMMPDDFEIQIIDTGVGIPEDEQQHIFDTFFRATNVETIQGTGIGLSIVRRLVANCRGTIAYDSQPNQGTTVTLNFPRILMVE